MTYIVQSGDTLWFIAQRFGVSIQAIVNANPMTDTSMLRVGQRLFIPVAGGPQPEPYPPGTPTPYPPGPPGHGGDWGTAVGRLERRIAQLEQAVDQHRRQISDLQRRVSLLERQP